MMMVDGDYSEDALIEQPAIALFAELGYETANCFHEVFGATGTLGREQKGEVDVDGLYADTVRMGR